MKILHFWWKIMSDYLMHHLGIRYEPKVETRDSFSNLKNVLVCKKSLFQLFQFSPLILHILWDFYAQYDLPLSDLYNLIPPVVRSSTMGRHMMSALCTILYLLSLLESSKLTSWEQVREVVRICKWMNGASRIAVFFLLQEAKKEEGIWSHVMRE